MIDPLDLEDLLKIGWITDELEKEEDPDRDQVGEGESDDDSDE
jgi:hypothetical protein